MQVRPLCPSGEGFPERSRLTDFLVPLVVFVSTFSLSAEDFVESRGAIVPLSSPGAHPVPKITTGLDPRSESRWGTVGTPKVVH